MSNPLDNEKELTQVSFHKLDLLKSETFKNHSNLCFDSLLLEIRSLGATSEFILVGNVIGPYPAKNVRIAAEFLSSELARYWRLYALRLLRALECASMPILGGEEETSFGWKG